MASKRGNNINGARNRNKRMKASMAAISGSASKSSSLKRRQPNRGVAASWHGSMA